MEGLVEFPGDSPRSAEFQGKVVGRFRESTSDDARNDGCRRVWASAIETWLKARLEVYDQCDDFPAGEKTPRSAVTPAHVVQTDSLKKEPNRLKPAAAFR